MVFDSALTLVALVFATMAIVTAVAAAVGGSINAVLPDLVFSITGFCAGFLYVSYLNRPRDLNGSS